MKTSSRVVVLGGAGAVGGMLAGMLEQAGISTLCIDRHRPGYQVDSVQLDLEGISTCDHRLFHDAMAVVFALPECVALQLLPTILPLLGADVLVVPTCSVQGPFHETLKACAPGQPWMGVNPMFSPGLDVAGRSAVICLDDLNVPTLWLERLLSETGLVTRRMTVEQHDRTMALCQALPHAAVIAFGMALADSGADLATLLAIAPPPMRTLFALVSRILANPVEVYWDVQHENPHAAEQRTRLVNALTRLYQGVHEHDQQLFARQLSDVAYALGSHRLSGARDCEQLFRLLNGQQPHSAGNSE